MKKLSNIIIIATVLLVISLLWGTTLHYNYHFDSKEKPILYYTFENSNVVKLYHYLLGERHSEPIDRSSVSPNKLYLEVKNGIIYKSDDEKICHQAIISPDYIFFPDPTLNEKEIQKIKKGQRDCRLSLVTNHIMQVTMCENNKVKKMYGFALSWDEFKALNPQASPLDSIFLGNNQKGICLPSEKYKFHIFLTLASEKSRMKKEEKKQDENPVVRFDPNPEYVSYKRMNNGDYLKIPLSVSGKFGETVTYHWEEATIIEK